MPSSLSITSTACLFSHTSSAYLSHTLHFHYTLAHFLLLLHKSLPFLHPGRKVHNYYKVSKCIPLRLNIQKRRGKVKKKIVPPLPRGGGGKSDQRLWMEEEEEKDWLDLHDTPFSPFQNPNSPSSPTPVPSHPVMRTRTLIGRVDKKLGLERNFYIYIYFFFWPRT